MSSETEYEHPYKINIDKDDNSTTLQQASLSSWNKNIGTKRKSTIKILPIFLK